METGSPSPPGGSPVLPSYLDHDVEVDGNKFDIPLEIFFCTIHDIGRVTPEPSSSWTKL